MLVILEGEMVMTKIMAHRRREREIERQQRKEREKGREKGRLGNKMKPFRQI